MKADADLSQTVKSFQNCVPLTVGVTGHRSISESEIPRIEEEVREVFTELKRRYPHTPLVVISSLAEGADRLVARVACDPKVKAGLYVPLPFSEQIYENDFSSEESKTEFRRLMKRAGNWIWRAPLVGNSSEKDISQAGDARNQQYAPASAFVAKHSQILIALWDGEKGEGLGGTADAVRYKLEGVASDISEGPVQTDPLNVGPVYHIFTPQVGHTPTEASPKPKLLFPSVYDVQESVDPERFFDEHVFKPLETLNASESQFTGKQALVPITELQSLDDQRLSDGLWFIDRLFQRADTNAISYAKRIRSTLLVLSILVAFSALCLEFSNGLLGAKGLEQEKFLVGLGYPLLLLIANLIYHSAKHEKQQDKHQDYRALAEGLRVQFFWLLSGLSHSVSLRYLGKLRSELFWIRHVCRTAYLLAKPEQAVITSAQTKLVRAHWVKDQHLYFSRRGKQLRKQAKILRFAVQTLFWIGVLISLSVCAIGVALHVDLLIPTPGSLLEWVANHSLAGHATLMFVAVMTTVIAALCNNFVDKSALEENAKKFTRMEQLYLDAEVRLHQINREDDVVQFQSAILRLGDEALEENGDWVLTHRDRPVDVPHH